ncbi:ABC transporter ATP-binding protein [Phormidesmis priestleyi]|uniref:ABC transporter ATP-binding protein n=1 Tax=Phormidesmis priestleyi TaxID=268141 RepID=UPI00083A3C02|nr:ABC transporter ATP-binding protein [Phormidesmis priestleyi]
MGEAVISLKNVSKSFKRYSHPVDRLKEILLPGKTQAEGFWALKNVSLEVFQGETLGIIGQNGSGKSTLLQIIAGTLQPTLGEVAVRGRVSALLELGSGFNPEFTGRQNVFFNGRILGLSHAEIEARFDDIAAFAEIGDFIDQPVKTYSSGMFVRLAFAVAVHVDPEVLIVDEALAVGDGIFVHRCMAKIKDFQDSGGTILFVSHDVGAVARLCSRGVWINSGSLVSTGEPPEISRRYQAWMYEQINAHHRAEVDAHHLPYAPLIHQKQQEAERQNQSRANPFMRRAYLAFSQAKRFGTGRAEIVDFKILDSTGAEAGFLCPGEWVKIVVRILAHDQIQMPLIGVSIYDRLRTAITGFNNYQYRYELPELTSGSHLDVEFCTKWPDILGGSYVLEPAIADGTQDSHEMLDWLQLLLTVESSATNLTFGMIRISEMEISHSIT